jgi:hypothetical protein
LDADKNGRQSGSYLWDLATRALVATFRDPGRKASVNFVAFDRSGNTLAVADNDGLGRQSWRLCYAREDSTDSCSGPRDGGGFQVAIAFELLALAWIRRRFFGTHFLSSIVSVTLGGAVIATISAALD